MIGPTRGGKCAGNSLLSSDATPSPSASRPRSSLLRESAVCILIEGPRRSARATGRGVSVHADVAQLNRLQAACVTDEQSTPYRRSEGISVIFSPRPIQAAKRLIDCSARVSVDGPAAERGHPARPTRYRRVPPRLPSTRALTRAGRSASSPGSRDPSAAGSD